MPDYYSFGGVKFAPRVADGVPMVEAPETIISERHIPYSNRTVLDIGGKGPRRYTAEVRIAPADLVNWESKLLVSGTLVIAGVTWPQATLTSLTGHLMTPGGEWHWYTASWVVG